MSTPQYFLKSFPLFLSLFSFTQLCAQDEKLNILFIISDDLNTNIGSYMDIPSHTPNLNTLALRGVRFNSVYCQYPLCGPSRASLMSGLYPESNGIIDNSKHVGSYRKANPKLSDHPSLAGFFRENGYYTARVSKIFHMGVPGGIEQGEAGDDDPDSWDYTYNVLGPETNSPGKLELLSPGTRHYGGAFSQIILKNGDEGGQTDVLATNQAIAILESRAGNGDSKATNLQKLKKDQPFFLAVGLVRPHVPFIAPERSFTPYPTEKIALPDSMHMQNVPSLAYTQSNRTIFKMNISQKKKTVAAYMASVQFMDEQVGRLLEALDRLDLRKNTIVVFVSDRGYNLGEHDSWGKRTLWEGSIRVPMIVSVPDQKYGYGTANNALIELIDLYPTLLDLAGFDPNQKPEILQGRSFAPLIYGQEMSNPRQMAYTISFGGKASSLRTQNWHYTHYQETNEEELYFHKIDPMEDHNVARDEKYEKQLLEMRGLLRSKKEEIVRFK